MAVLEIARMGHPVLSGVAEAVADPLDPAIAALIADMIETMRAMAGIGLAAPQIAVAKRVLIFELPEGPVPAGPVVEGPVTEGPVTEGPVAEGEALPGDAPPEMVLTTLINPVIEPVGEAMEEAWEGCLSLPGMAGLVPRYVEVRYRGVTPEGDTIAREVSGFHARVVQHEADHLDGILYPMRIKDISNFGYIDEMEKTLPEL